MPEHVAKYLRFRWSMGKLAKGQQVRFMGALEITGQLSMSESIPVVRQVTTSYRYVEAVRYHTYQSAHILALLYVPRWFLNIRQDLCH
jgi:hypothetical protein